MNQRVLSLLILFFALNSPARAQLKAQVVNTFFVGKFTSWMNNELRIKSGLTYGAGSYFDFNRKTGSFIISTHTANATTQATIDKVPGSSQGSWCACFGMVLMNLILIILKRT